MKIVDAYARLLPPPGYLPESPFTLGHGEELLRRVEWCARISHRTEEAQTDTSHARFLRTWVMEHGDFSTIEHCGITADLLVDRGLSHELVRHRIAAYTQESTRFVNYSKREDVGLRVILPPDLVPLSRSLGPLVDHFQLAPDHMAVAYVRWLAEAGRTLLPREEVERLATWYLDWLDGVRTAERHYLYQVVHLRVPPELARDMLPHCFATRMVATHDLRGWRHLMLMRTTAETHRKLRPLMGDLLAELQAKVPVLFEDLVFGARQAENLRRGR